MFCCNLLSEVVGFQDPDAAAVVEQPVYEVGGYDDFYAKEDAAVRKFFEALRGVPLFFSDPVAGFRFEMEHDLDRGLTCTGHHSPGLAQVVEHVEIGGDRVVLAGKRGLADSVYFKGPDCLACLAECDDVPTAHVDLYVIGADGALARVPVAGAGFIEHAHLLFAGKGVVEKREYSSAVLAAVGWKRLVGYLIEKREELGGKNRLQLIDRSGQFG